MNCKKLEFPLVKIPQESKDIKTYFDLKLSCLSNTKSNNIIDQTTDQIVKMNNNFEVKKMSDPYLRKFAGITNFYPVYTFLKNIGQSSINMLLDSSNLT